MQTENKDNILVIGGAGLTSVKEILKYKVEKIDVVEQDNKFIELVERYLTTEELIALKNDKVNIINMDGRFFVKACNEKYDCIILCIGDPLTLASNRYYTKEFFENVLKILNKQGILYFSISSNENYMSLNMLRYNARIYWTLKHVFKNVIILPGDNLQFIASINDGYITENVSLLIQRFRQADLKTYFVNENRIPFIFDKNRIDFIKSSLSNIKSISINKDFTALSFFDALSLYSSQFGYMTGKVFRKISFFKWNYLFILPILLLILLFIVYIKNKIYIPFVVCYIGFVGITVELLIMFGFQIFYGNVYILIGLLVASFMAGIVLGASYIK